MAMRVQEERLPTYTVRNGSLYEELKHHAELAYSRTGVEQVVCDQDSNIVDIIGCKHEHVTKHYGRPLTCDRCCRYQDESTGEWKVRKLERKAERVDSDAPVE